MTRPLALTVMRGELAIARLAARTPLSAVPRAGELWSVTRAGDELSVVLPVDAVPHGWRREAGWRSLRVEGPLDLAEVGILARLATALAEACVSLFAISTFDTDYLLVRGAALERAVAALVRAGYELRRDDAT